MIKSKEVTLIFVFLAVVNFGVAQNRDSIPQKVIAYVADKFPSARVLNVEYIQLAPYRFSSEASEADLPENKVDHYSQIKANANFTFIKKPKWLLGIALTYRYTAADVEKPVALFSTVSSDEGNFHYHSEAINFTYFSKLWNKMAIYSATVSADGSEKHFERLRGMLTATLLLKANARTKIALGVAGFVDASTRIPALPIFSYEHKFDNGWMADVILPKKILIRREIFASGRISCGTEMDNTSFYLYQSGKTYEYRQMEINSGAIYEHKLGAFIGTLKSGVRIVPNGRIFEKGDFPKDYVFESRPKPSFYCNLGISYNPFETRRNK